jgi:hypothetical protein
MTAKRRSPNANRKLPIAVMVIHRTAPRTRRRAM